VNADVNEKSKVNHSKLSHVSRRQHHREKSIEVCSESESDTDKRSTFSRRRRTFIRPDRFDGVTLTFARHILKMQLSLIGGVNMNSWHI